MNSKDQKTKDNVVYLDMLELTDVVTKIAFDNAVKTIDDKFGHEGYAMKNPTLLASVVSFSTEVYSARASEFALIKARHDDNIGNS